MEGLLAHALNTVLPHRVHKAHQLRCNGPLAHVGKRMPGGATHGEMSGAVLAARSSLLSWGWPLMGEASAKEA